MLLTRAPVVVFQKWMFRSYEPPPVARRLSCHGHQLSALTAARWFFFANLGAARDRASQMETRLSLPPVASCAPSDRHSRPQTSDVWETSSATLWSAIRTSWLKTRPLRAPVDRVCLFQPITPTRVSWPNMLRSLVPSSTSQIWTSPEPRPTPTYAPSPDHLTLLTYVSVGTSSSWLTVPLSAVQT